MYVILDEFRAELLRQDKSLATIKHYVNDVDLYGRWIEASYGEEFNPAKTVQREITEYRSYLTTVKSCSANTINRRLASLGKFFGWLQASGRIKVNPVVGVRGIAVIDPGVQSIDTASLRRLLREVHVHDNKLHICIVEVLSGSAMRVGELCALAISDVEMSERKGVLHIRNGKGNVARNIPMNSDVRKSVANWLQVRPTSSSNKLLLGQRGDGMTPSGIWRIVKRYAALAGIPDMKIHTLRHCALTRLCRHFEVDLPTCAKISGHRNIKTLMRYCAPTEQDVSDAIDKLVLAGD